MPKLTKTAVDRLSHNGSSFCALWDSDVPGFGVRVLASGTKTFVFRYRHRGRRHYITIGRYGPLTLKQASDRAREFYAAHCRGEDPASTRAPGTTFADLADAYVRIHLPTKKRQRDDQAMLRNHLTPHFGTMPVDEITRATVVRFHDKMAGGGRKVAANRAVALVSKMWNFGRERGLVPEALPNPAQGVQNRKFEVRRNRYVTVEEMPKLRVALDAETDPYAKGFIWLTLFTGCRLSELLYLRWEDVGTLTVDGAQVTVIRIRDTKSGKPHTLPLSPEAVMRLYEIPRSAGGGLIFRGTRKDGTLYVRGAWERIREGAGLQDVRIHDLRHTMASWGANAGISLAALQAMLNHSSPQVTDRYAHMAMGSLVQSVNKVGGLIAGTEGVVEDEAE